MNKFKCQICNSSDTKTISKCHDFQLGLEKTFTYFQCRQCNCIQISDVQKDLTEHYPKHYYSFKASTSNQKSLRETLRKKRDKYAATGKGIVGSLLSKIQPYQTLEIIKRTGVVTSSKILDVGCGSGEYLKLLNEAGFMDLEGIDPFLETDISDGPVKISKKDIYQLKTNSVYDLIMLHHSFEHMNEPQKVIFQINNLLKKGGKCIIRIPKVPSYGWKRFGTHWFHLDAPRHMFIHSKESIKLLIKNTDLSLMEVIDDMKEISIWGSIQYQKGVSLYNQSSYLVNPSKSIFSSSDIASYKKISKELNKQQKGDTAAFILEKQ